MNHDSLISELEPHCYRSFALFLIRISLFLAISSRYGITTSLTYEELLPFVIDPSWMRARKISFSAITIAFFVILLAACISAYTSMSKMSCGSMPVALLRSDNGSLGLIGEASLEGAKAVVSIVLNATASNITT